MADIKSKSARFFEVRIRYTEDTDDAKKKHTVETQAIEAETFVEAATKAMDYNKSLEEIEIKAIKIAPFVTVVYYPHDDADVELKYFRAKVTDLITIDDGKEKKSAVNYLIQAPTMGDARDLIVKFMDGTPNKYEIASVSVANIVEVVEHE